LHRRLPRPLFAGTATAVPTRVEGTTSATRLDLLIVDEGEPALVGLVPCLAGRDAVEVVPAWVPARRGRRRFGPVGAMPRYRLGWSERGRDLLPAGGAIVGPAWGEIQRGRLTRTFQRRQNRQPVRSRPRPERTAQQEILGLRPFRIGDSPRL